MQVFVVVDTQYMNSSHAVAVFSTHKTAQSYIDRTGPEGYLQIKECFVLGELKEPGVVFAACIYDPGKEVHFFDSLYENYEKAKITAGNKGQARRMTIDERIA